MICQSPRSSSVFVTQVEDISPKIRRIRVCGERIKNMQWTPGQKIKIKVGTYLRSYTPARVASDFGWMDLIFYLHGKGKASRWAENVCVGTSVSFIGPADSMPFVNQPLEWCLFLGDETTLGLSMALLNALPKTVRRFGAIEMESEDLGALSVLQIPLNPIQRDEYYGYALIQWLSLVSIPDGEGVVWISGEAQMVRNLRLALITRGLRPEQIKVKAYWSLKGHAHRKTLQSVM